jgi:uncharacterized Fe-S cluster protein YjdI/CDGSH-type Zn-finger protein
MATREYEGNGITVHWESDRCLHSERCTMGLPAVFDPDARPWVHPDGASADDVAAVIDTCPSGALSYTRTDGAPNGRRGRASGEDPAPSLAVDPAWESTSFDTATGLTPTLVTITPLTNGPLSVVGCVGVTQSDGTVTVAQRLQLCRCGHSGSKPICDGSHARVGFTAPGAPMPSSAT